MSIVDGRVNAEVWNTFRFNECPQEEWAALDADAIKTERGVFAAILNGPRYWLMDAIERMPSGVPETTTFGTLQMALAATVDIGPVPPNTDPYIERHVDRGTVFEFAAGSEVYELLDASGGVFVMQSYSIQRNPELTESELASLASQLNLPDGWIYRARVLDDKLRVDFETSVATVIQDDLGNTYSLVEN